MSVDLPLDASCGFEVATPIAHTHAAMMSAAVSRMIAQVSAPPAYLVSSSGSQLKSGCKNVCLMPVSLLCYCLGGVKGRNTSPGFPE